MRSTSLFKLLAFAFGFALPFASFSDGPADNQLDNVRRMPPPGVRIAAAERETLSTKTKQLQSLIASIEPKLSPRLKELLPDVLIYHKAVDWALRYDEFYHATNEVAAAHRLLQEGTARAEALSRGTVPWLKMTGQVVRGYRSAIDGSVQPYGLVIPSSYKPESTTPHRLDFWFHGRGEKLTELAFIDERSTRPGEFTPPDTFVLHPYSRYCNGQKFAGETDAFEALEHVQKNYQIDRNRIAVRGFSLGGAACWHMAVHHPTHWAAAAPGAGFSETAQFLRVFQNEKVAPPWWEQKLWNLYDSPPYAINLFNLPTVAYSGEIDRQKQAADVMAEALAAEGVDLVHIIGPNTPHRYHPESKVEINRRMDSILAQGRDEFPKHVKFATYTLKYNKAAWLRIDSLKQHWERAYIEGEITPLGIKVIITNITAFSISFPAGCSPFPIGQKFDVEVNGVKQAVARTASDRTFEAAFNLSGKSTSGLAKKHNLQGPIDDAFMSGFIFVRPTGKALNDAIGKWVNVEIEHAIEHWRRHFRGNARVINDTELTEEHLTNYNIVLWGDPSSNTQLSRILEKLPLKWSEDELSLGTNKVAAAQHIPALIYPNPLNPSKYVVLNSSFTFREYDYLNNARQVPKLPDWALIDISHPVTSRYPGKIAAAGFFNESWEVK